MAARASVNQVRQIGDESTPGTGVPGDKQLSSLSLNLRPTVDAEDFRAAGAKSTTSSAINGMGAEGDYDGPTDYNEIIWPLEGLVGSTGPTGGGVAKTRDYAPATYGADANAKTFTAECGDAEAARVYTRVRFRSFQLVAGRRTGTRVSGGLLANYPTDGQTLTASPTVIAPRPVQGKQWDVYLDSTFGGIGTTKLTKAYRIGFAVGDKFNNFYALNSANGNNADDDVEIPHDITGQFSIMHNAASRAVFAGIPDNSVQFLRFIAQGAVLESSTRETIRFDIAILLRQPDDDDIDGVYGVTYNFTSIYDSSLGGHWKARSINAVPAV